MSIRSLKPGEHIPDGPPKRYPSREGYIRCRWQVGLRSYVETPEHRINWGEGVVVMAEHVHHENRRRDDNSPSNLKPMTAVDHGREHRVYDRSRIVEMYRAGRTTTSISSETGCDSGQVSRILAAEGIPIRPPSQRRRDVDPLLVEGRLRAGEPVRRVAREMSCSPLVVERIRRLAGIPPQRPGRPRSAAP